MLPPEMFQDVLQVRIKNRNAFKEICDRCDELPIKVNIYEYHGETTPYAKSGDLIFMPKGGNYAWIQTKETPEKYSCIPFVSIGSIASGLTFKDVGELPANIQ